MNLSEIYPTTLVDVLRWRALHQPERLAYKFLKDGEAEEVNLTYKELDLQARAIAARLQSSGAQDQRALLLYPAGLEFIAAYMGCLYSRTTAVPVYPPNPARPGQHITTINGIAKDAKPFMALTTSAIMARTGDLFKGTPELRSIRWLATDKIPATLAENWRCPVIDRNTLAFLQYTSGSTTAPRGVMLSHENLLYNQRMIRQAMQLSQDTLAVGWLPLYHDMGLIGNVLQSLYEGFPCVLMAPLIFIQRPFRWLQAISRFRATASGGPNFAYDLCVRRITPGQRSTLDLSSWELAFLGAEPINSETLEQFAEYFAPCGFRPEAFYPCYGLAEATLMVSGGSKAARPLLCSLRQSPPAPIELEQLTAKTVKNEGTRKLVGCGQAIMNQEIVIADPHSLTRCPPGQEGEIWVSGPSVARGYWNKPKETGYVFRAHLADTGEGPFLRTGDLGFLKNGELFITGRIKDLIIIDGTNHYPQDIEWTVEKCHQAVRENACAAFSIEVKGREQLVVLAELDPRYYRMRKQQEKDNASDFNRKNFQTPEVEKPARAIRRAVSKNHDLGIHDLRLLKAGSIFKTSSGKVQRKACREAYLSGTLEALEV